MIPTLEKPRHRARATAQAFTLAAFLVILAAGLVLGALATPDHPWSFVIVAVVLLMVAGALA